MMNIIRPDTKFDFMGSASLFTKLSIGLFVAAVAVVAVRGVNLGLDFAGGHEVLLEFEQPITSEEVRGRLNELFPEVDTAVQRFDVPTSTGTFYLTRIERSESLGEDERTRMRDRFQDEYGDVFEGLDYNPEAGDVVKVDFTENATVAGADLSSQKLSGVTEDLGHPVRLVRQVGRPDEQRYEIVLKGVDVTLVNGMKPLDPNVRAARVEFVGPTVGKQLRNDGILAILYALGFILLYVAFRFDVFYGPGAIACLVHDAIITVALLSLLGAQFSLATIAGLLTLVGYSINDTIVIFDRIRERLGGATGAAMDSRINQAINETLGRTIMTSATTLLACFCLMFFGRGTVMAEFGLIMTVGILIGTYSSIYVAAPTFRLLRNRFSTD
ncbi:MAG TPA: protein translocase subunit SecF [Myxococcales bacterium LLY-WYZ-16_1]|jgi:preprotein translocase subunit SecF|nr:protein translocase subunit SecF [Myxococcales bacterium LLY-WYZ-16_1]